MERVAIVILNWNGADMLMKFLPSVLKYSLEDAVVYVADNASTDNSIEILKQYFPDIRIIQLENNWGFAEGYNKALENINAEYYVLMNSDVKVTYRWLLPLIEFMDNHPDVAACQPKLLSEKDNDYFEYAGASGGYLDCYGYPFCRGRIFDTVEADNGQYDCPAEVLWATGACMMIRPSDFRLSGGFDARFFAHNEEIDLCWRLRLMGRNIYCIPDSFVFHVGGGTLPKNNPMKTYLNFRNNLLMLYKNLPDDKLNHVFHMRMILDYIAAFKALATGCFGDFKAILKARRTFREWLPEYRDIRKQVQKMRITDNIEGISSYSILWQYYVKGHKKYSELDVH